MKTTFVVILIAVTPLVTGCGKQDTSDSAGESSEAGLHERRSVPATAVSAARIEAANETPGEWLSHGRTYDEQRFSPLNEITTANISELGLAWYYDIPTERGMEATPIVVGDRMYVTGSWSIVYALDAATGEELWTYDPGVPKSWAQYACCDVVNRGVAVWGDDVFVGTLDGFLVSLNAATGEVNWRADTINRKPPYTITGAPRVVKGNVLIGNGGADYGVRGYISAYDVETGELNWRFYTVPGNPEGGFENELLEKAAATWTGEWWKYGGGGTVWDSMAYDAELDLLYFGVGNGSPWNQKIRSPGGGDNLFLSSIVAVRPDNGEYVWHYQTTPGETWDYTATQQIILADLDIDGVNRKVLMQAPKNGFFYVIDRQTGELISAEPYVAVSWATGIDKTTGRPIETPNARYENGVAMVTPSGFGGHNWHSMAFSPDSSLVYVPAQELPAPYADEAEFEFTEGFWNSGTEFEALQMPDDPAVAAEIAKMFRGQLIAWDPVEQKEVWRYQHAGPWNGGVLATAGELVFQGSLIGEFAAYDANSGDRVWQFGAQTGVAAAPISYSVNDQQHVAVAAGWGSIFVLFGGEGTAALGYKGLSRILAFRRGGQDALPELESRVAKTLPEPPANDASDAQLAAGKDIYYERCVICHGESVVSGGVMPDLRHASDATHAAWDGIVLGGAYQNNGMPGFGQILNKEQSDAVHAFVISRARLAYDRQQATAR